MPELLEVHATVPIAPVYWSTDCDAHFCPVVLASKWLQPVDRDDLSTRDSPRAIIHRRSRLSLTIPAQLDALIDDVPTRAYRLRLAPDEIILLHWGDDEQLVDVGAELPTLT